MSYTMGNFSLPYNEQKQYGHEINPVAGVARLLTPSPPTPAEGPPHPHTNPSTPD